MLGAHGNFGRIGDFFLRHFVGCGDGSGQKRVAELGAECACNGVVGDADAHRASSFECFWESGGCRENECKRSRSVLTQKLISGVVDVLIMQADVNAGADNEAVVQGVIDETMKTFGRIDVLINNAQASASGDGYAGGTTI